MHVGSAGLSSASMCCSACFAVFQTSTSEIDLDAAVAVVEDRLGVAGDRQLRVVRAAATGRSAPSASAAVAVERFVHAAPRSVCLSSTAFARAWSAFV